MPKPVLALPCGSRSITSTRSPEAASAVARLTAVVVLPTPPFWLAIATIRARRDAATGCSLLSFSGLSVTGPYPAQTQDDAARIGAARMVRGIELPFLRCGSQLLPGLLALWEEAYRLGADKSLRIDEKPVERGTAAGGDDGNGAGRDGLDS